MARKGVVQTKGNLNRTWASVRTASGDEQKEGEMSMGEGIVTELRTKKGPLSHSGPKKIRENADAARA